MDISKKPSEHTQTIISDLSDLSDQVPEKRHPGSGIGNQRLDLVYWGYFVSIYRWNFPFLRLLF